MTMRITAAMVGRYRMCLPVAQTAHEADDLGRLQQGLDFEVGGGVELVLVTRPDQMSKPCIVPVSAIGVDRIVGSGKRVSNDLLQFKRG